MKRKYANIKPLVFITTESGCQCCVSHSVNSSGHVNAMTDTGAKLLHSVIYEFKHGPVPAGHDLHHECHNKRCVNTDHLTVLTHAEHSKLHRLLRYSGRELPAGVYAKGDRFVAQRRHAGKIKHVGIFATVKESIAAIQQHKEQHHAFS